MYLTPFKVKCVHYDTLAKHLDSDIQFDFQYRVLLQMKYQQNKSSATITLKLNIE